MATNYVYSQHAAIPQQFTSQVEDVSPTISRVDPWMNPVTSRMKSEKTRSTAPSWQVDYPLPPNPTPRPYGLDVRTNNAFYPTTQPFKAANYVQVFVRTFRVSIEALNTAQHGIANKLSYDEEKHMTAFKRDMEVAVLDNRSAAATNSSASGLWNQLEAFPAYSGTTPFVQRMSGIPCFPQSNVVLGNKAGGNTAADRLGTIGGWNRSKQAHISRTTAGNNKMYELSETELITIMQAMATNNGNSKNTNIIFMGNHNQAENFNRVQSTVSGAPSRQINGIRPSGGIGQVSTVDFYQTNYGIIRFVPNQWMDYRTIYIFNMGTWKKKVLVNQRRDILGKTGNTIDVMISTAFTICIDNELKFAALFDVNPGNYNKALVDLWASDAGSTTYDGTYKGKTGTYNGSLTGEAPGYPNQAAFDREQAAWSTQPYLTGGLTGG